MSQTPASKNTKPDLEYIEQKLMSMFKDAALHYNSTPEHHHDTRLKFRESATNTANALANIHAQIRQDSKDTQEQQRTVTRRTS